jgi:hypothetical protein
MNSFISGLAGVIVGFLLNLLVFLYINRSKGQRYYIAETIELLDAISKISDKINWLSRDESKFKFDRDENLLVKENHKLLYLGEKEDFTIDLRFWDENLNEIVIFTNNRKFKMLFETVLIIKRFETKFKEMKMAFKTIDGNPKQMALACYHDLLEIHKDLLKNRLKLKTK